MVCKYPEVQCLPRKGLAFHDVRIRECIFFFFSLTMSAVGLRSSFSFKIILELIGKLQEYMSSHIP